MTDHTDNLLARFEAEHMAPNSITPLRRAEQLRVLRRFAASLYHPLDQLTVGDLQSFMGAEIDRGQHPNTVRKRLGMIRAFITWATTAGLIDLERSVQLKSVRNPRGSTARSVPRPYTSEQIATFRHELAETYPALPMSGQGSKMIEHWCRGKTPLLRSRLWRHAVRVQLELQIALALELGLRRLEIFQLTEAALHYDNDEVVVLTAKQGPGREATRTVPYTGHARQCAFEWLELRTLLMPDHDSVWLYLRCGGSRAEQLKPLPMWKMGDQLKPLPGHWEWHRLRHTAATEWLRAGVPLEKLRVMMGHATLEQTLAYAKIVGSDLNTAVGAAEADFNRRLGIAS